MPTASQTPRGRRLLGGEQCVDCGSVPSVGTREYAEVMALNRAFSGALQAAQPEPTSAVSGYTQTCVSGCTNDWCSVRIGSTSTCKYRYTWTATVPDQQKAQGRRILGGSAGSSSCSAEKQAACYGVHVSGMTYNVKCTYSSGWTSWYTSERCKLYTLA